MNALHSRRSAASGAARWTALAIGFAVAASIAAIWFATRRRSAPPIELREVAPLDDSELAARRKELEDLGSAIAPRAWRFELSPELASRIFPLETGETEFDPYTYFHRIPSRDIEIEWPEHPNGVWHLRTNSLGLREDRELATTQPDVRILAIGDSHTDGVCDNSESWPHRLEAALHETLAKQSIEVINTGTGYYSFFNYRGAVERFRDLHCNTCIVAVYGGNDFLEVTKPWHYFAGTTRPTFTPEVWKTITAARVVDGAALAQALTSARYFKEFPDEIETAIEASLALCADLLGTCESRGTRVVFVYIPSRFEVERKQAATDAQKGMRALGLELSDLENADVLAARFIAGLRTLGAPTIDLRQPFRQSREPLYWNKDLHIDLAANVLIARELAPWITKLAERR